MQVIILAAGKSSRFFPFNQNIHKSENILYGKPIIEWTVNSLTQTDIDEVIIIKNKDQNSIPQIFKNKTYPFKLTFADQDKPQGMGDAILSVKHLIKDQFIAIGPHHVNAQQIYQQLQSVNHDGVVIAVRSTDNPSLYGIVEIDDQNRVISLVEKPDYPVENAMKVVTIYKLTKDFVENMAGFAQEEYLLESALNKYLKNNTVKACHLTQETSSLKYPWHLFDLQKTLSQMVAPQRSSNAFIAPNATVEDSVIIEDGAKIYEGACIKGHTYIGKNVIVGNNAVIRDSILEQDCQVGVNSEITRSIIMQGVHSHGGGFIGDSIIGERTHLAAGFITANQRLDKQNIQAYIQGNKIDTKRKKLGTLIGSNVEVGIRASTMPNVIIGNKAVILPGEIVKKNVI